MKREEYMEKNSKKAFKIIMLTIRKGVTKRNPDPTRNLTIDTSDFSDGANNTKV